LGLKTYFSWVILAALPVLLFVVDLSTGSVNISFREVLQILTFNGGGDQVIRNIILDFRLTKAITCLLAGSCLSLAGLQMQTFFRNPLAGPDVLGLSSGASLAVSLIFMGQTAGIVIGFQSPWAVAISASIGAAAVFAIMLLVARRLQDNVSLLIVGLMVGAATSSVVSVLQYLSKAEEMQVYIIWTFGSLGGLNWEEITVLFFVMLAGSLLAVSRIKTLNAWLLGDLYAQSIGVNIRRSRFFILLSACILTGGVTAFCGPIAFVGIAVPHLVKIIIKTSDHKKLIPAVLLGGGSLLLFCDIISQLPGDYILPVNAITAMIGAPVVIWIIMSQKTIRN
jgi:iron complex transport system permease protein